MVGQCCWTRVRARITAGRGELAISIPAHATQPSTVTHLRSNELTARGKEHNYQSWKRWRGGPTKKTNNSINEIGRQASHGLICAFYVAPSAATAKRIDAEASFALWKKTEKLAGDLISQSGSDEGKVRDAMRFPKEL